MKETELSRKIIKLLQFSGIFVQRIESPMTGVGIPDLFFRTTQTDGWIEFKVIQHPIKLEQKKIKIPFRPGQLNWIKNYVAMGGNAFLFISIDSSLFIFKNKNIERSYTQETFIKKAKYAQFLKDVDAEDIVGVLDNDYKVINLI
jgi:hypothetical protein